MAIRIDTAVCLLKGHVDVLIDRTKSELNIDFLTLVAGSTKKIYVKCTRCGEEFQRERRNLHQKHHCPIHITRADGLRLKWCNRCQNYLPFISFSNNAARPDGLDSYCKTCKNTLPAAKRHNAKHAAKRQTVAGWITSTINLKRTYCRKRNIEFNIDTAYLHETHDLQKGLCYYSNIPLTFGTRSIFSASLERLDPKYGYIIGNVVLASKAMNYAKSSASREEFQDFLSQLTIGLTIPIRLECKRIHPLSKLPVRSRTTDAGFDIACVENGLIPPHGVINFDTGIIVTAPPGFYISVDGRSSLWSKGVMPFRGIIDSTYTGVLKVAMMNISDEPYQVECGDRIAQIILHRALHADFAEVDEFSPEYNQRGEAGFGSSGKK